MRTVASRRTGKRGWTMITMVIGGIIGVLVSLYLFYALLYPERL
ncbi:MAG: potassium-transporting ATPase subunit F [Thermaerobacter sp.]|nr:potassium-transporting ATPase subunit F [Thermaerobacter sp.]